MTIYSYDTAVKKTEGHIDCFIKHPKYGRIPYTCNKDDNPEFYAVMEADPNTKLETPEEYSEKKTFEERDRRNFLLINEVDPIVGNPLRWESMSAEKQQEWRDYRQALLDIPQQPGFPLDIVIPKRPSE